MNTAYRFFLYKVSLWLCLLMSANKGMAVDILRFEWISDRDGLSQNTVRCIRQDSKGFMWLGTINGLNRYNGKEFIVMQPQMGDFASLPDNRIRGMLEDSYGYIWIRTTANIFCCYDPRLEQFVDYSPDNKFKNFSYIRICKNGDVWLWETDEGCCRIRHNGRELQPQRFGLEAGNAVRFVYEDSLQQVWIGASKGLYRLEDEQVVQVLSGSDFFSADEAGGLLFFVTGSHVLPFDLRKQAFGEAAAFPGNRLPALNASTMSNGMLLIATHDEVLMFDTRKMAFVPSSAFFGETVPGNANFITDNKGNKWVYNLSGNVWRALPGGRFERYNLIPPHILSTIDAERYDIWHDSRNIVWITTYGNGLFAIDMNNGQPYHYTAGNSDLPTNYLLCATEDRSGEIWVGTEFAGISKISLANHPVDIFYPAPDEHNDRGNAVRLIYEDSQGRYWLGTRTGYLHIYDASFRKIQSHLITGGPPFAITEDTLGNIWVGTRGKGLMIFPPSGEAPLHTYKLHDIGRQNTSSNNIFYILRDSRNRIWIATFGGGLHLAENNGKEITFRHINARTVNQDMVRVILQDRTGLMWAGTNEGINVFDPDKLLADNNDYTNFRFDIHDGRSLNNNEVKAIFEDHRGRLWFGTTGGGLNLLVREEPIERSWFKHYTAKNGLSNEVIQTILEDGDGYIWVSTESGISRFDPQTERFENFSFSGKQHAGLFNESSCWKMSNGKLMFGSYAGVFILNPSEINYNAYTPPVVITGLKINGMGALPGKPDSPLAESIAMTEKIKLNHRQNSFNIEFALLDFHSPGFNQYMYFLEGHEKDWNPVSRHNIAAYRNLPPGTYHFRVKGSNSFGVWTESETVLEIAVVPPFWKSTWAFILYFAVLMAVVFFISRIVLQIHRLNTAVVIEKQLTEYKLRFFTNISHEFRTPLTIIRGSIENLISMENLPAAVGKQIQLMSKSSTRLLRLIDQLLEFRRLQNNRLELKLERTEAVGFFYDIHQTFRELAGKKNIRFVFDSTAGQQEMLLDRGKMDKIAYNLLFNAMKHTPENGAIIMRLVFSEQDDRLVLSISDSGAGIPADKRGSLFVRFAQIDYMSGGMGVGLHLAAELVAVHKGKIDYSDSELGGACFSVSIPLSDNHYGKGDIIPSPQPPPARFVDIASGPVQTIETPQTGQRFKDYKLLAIEDDDEVREFILNQLGETFTVCTAKDGGEGLEKAGNEQPDLIICDVMMPGVDGFEVTRRLKEDFQTSHIPVILLTAHSSDEHRLEGIEAGADAYITKPFSMKYLLARITKLIEQREKLQQKFAREPGIAPAATGNPGKDQEFLDKIHRIIEQNMKNADFSVDTFAQVADMGRTVFYKKVRGITGHSPNEYIRIIRMKKAAELLVSTNLNVSEVSYNVGISDPFYFSKCFKAQFGKSPSQFQKGKP